MTNQPFPQQGFQQFPQQPMGQQGFQQPMGQQGFQQFPQQGFQQPMGQQFPQQGFPQAPMASAQPAPVQGSLDAFNAQPTGSRAAGLTWANVQPNTPEATFTGTVVADVTDRDVQQDSDPQTKQLKFYRDGRPMFHMAVGLKLDDGTYDASKYPDGNATLYVRGRMKDALDDAMGRAHVSGAPKEGDRVQITLVERRPGRGTIPANIYVAQYIPGPKWGVAQEPAPATAEQPQTAPAVPAQPVAPAQPQQAPATAEQPQQAPVVISQQAPAGIPQLTPEQQQLLAKLQG